MRILSVPIIVSILLASILSNVNAYKSYSKHELWRVYVRNNEQVARMLEFSRIAHLHGINFWSEEFRMNIPVSDQLCFLSTILIYLIRSLLVFHLNPLKTLPSIYYHLIVRSNMIS